MQLLQSKARELHQLAAFYLQCNYGGNFDAADDVFYAMEDGGLVAVVRLALESDVLVLRGMQVLPRLRGKQIGRQLLRYMINNISQLKMPCYCLPHTHLLNFYADVGFIIAKAHSSPAFLIKRKLKYTQQGLNIELMVRF